VPCVWRGRGEKGIGDFNGKTWRKEELEDLGVDGKIILPWIIRVCNGNVWIGFIWLTIETSGCFF
jgi:hypothetical protein